MITDKKKYLNLFKKATHEKAIGEATPVYLQCPSAAKEIKKDYPDSKIIISIRNPIDKAHSSYFSYKFMNLDNRSFSEKIDFYEKKSLDDEFDLFNFIEDGYFSKHIKRFQKVFPPEKIKIIFFEDYIKNVPTHINSIINFLEPLKVIVRSLPGVSELAQGKVKIDSLLQINLIDLLGRKPTEPNTELLKIKIRDKYVLVTGAGGSIGSELCRQIVILRPKKLILFEINEFSLYQVELELRKINLQGIEIVPIMGSIRDRKRLEIIFNHYMIQTIYHAAAYKHVPLMENNIEDAVTNNIQGTYNLVKIAKSLNIDSFINVSSDKSVNPTNINTPRIEITKINSTKENPFLKFCLFAISILLFYKFNLISFIPILLLLVALN